MFHGGANTLAHLEVTTILTLRLDQRNREIAQSQADMIGADLSCQHGIFLPLGQSLIHHCGYEQEKEQELVCVDTTLLMTGIQ